MILLGDFLVKPATHGFEIAGGEISTPGSWRENGLPFYSQQVAYSENFNVDKASAKGFKVKLTKWNGSVTEVLASSANPTPTGFFGPGEWNYSPEKKPDASDYFLMDYGLMEPFEFIAVK